MRVLWSRPAQNDFSRIDDFYAETAPEVAARVGADALRAGRFLGDYPRAGEVIDGDIRKWSVAGCPYLLLYRIATDRLEILRVRHEREDWRSSLK